MGGGASRVTPVVHGLLSLFFGFGLLTVIGRTPDFSSAFAICITLYTFSGLFINKGAPIEICNALAPMILALSNFVNSII